MVLRLHLGKDTVDITEGNFHYSRTNMPSLNKPPLHEAYTVTFVEQPSCHSLDICENKWYHLIDAQINIQNTILPHVKLLLYALLFDSIRCCLPLCALAFLSTQLAYSHRSVLKRTRGRFKCVPQRLNCPHMAYYFSLRLLVISPRVSF